MKLSTHSVSILGGINKNTNKYVHPKLANKKDKYVCPDCNKDLILCKGNIKVHHFRHYNDKENPCHYYTKPSNTQIHRDAQMFVKSLLESKQHIIVYRKCADCTIEIEYQIPEVSENTQIKIEHPFNYNYEDMKADVAYIDSDMEPDMCIFEIYNTHKTDERRRPEPWFEIDANKLNELNGQINQDTSGIIKLSCIRNIKCDKCIEKDMKLQEESYNKLSKLSLDSLLKNDRNTEFFIRYTLGQRDFVSKRERRWTGYNNQSGKSPRDHLRFIFDSQGNANIDEHNNRIINMFKKYFGRFKVVLNTYDCYANAKIIDENACLEYELNSGFYTGTIYVIKYFLRQINNIQWINFYKKNILHTSNNNVPRFKRESIIDTMYKDKIRLSI
jgi:hypothetical protein